VQSPSRSGRRAPRPISGEGRLPIEDGVFEYWPGFLTSIEASRYCQALTEKVPWTTPRVHLYGRWLDSPRLAAWYGDPGTVYRYSGTVNQPLVWLAELTELRERLVTFFGRAFNSVLLNHYRTGADSMGWHSDDEPELGPVPMIASLSLGGPRRFLLRHRQRKDLPVHEIMLGHGALLLMGVGSQAAWRHSVPRTARPVAPRINLTFRQVTITQSDAGT